jgi:hypothetical protein
MNNEIMKFNPKHFVEYFEKNLIDVDYPIMNPHNGLLNNFSFIIIKISMDEWSQLYKKLPKKLEVKGLQINFTTDAIDPDFIEKKYTAIIKNYKLTTYGGYLNFICHKGKEI